MRDSKRDTDVKNRLWTLWEKARVGGFERIALKHVSYHMCNRSPVQNSRHETGCSGPVHWDEPEGWDGEGGARGFRTGDTCTPMVDSCQYMATTLQYGN